MTNEEKAKEISQLWWRECGWQLQATAYDAAVEAMAWKDEEYTKEKQQLIEKVCEWLRHNMIGWDLGKYPEYAPNFIDDLKKAMKGE